MKEGTEKNFCNEISNNFLLFRSESGSLFLILLQAQFLSVFCIVFKFALSLMPSLVNQEVYTFQKAH